MLTLLSTDWLGYLAATLSFVPQALSTLRTRQVQGISLGMFSLFTLAYGWRPAAGGWVNGRLSLPTR